MNSKWMFQVNDEIVMFRKVPNLDQLEREISNLMI